MSICPPAEVAPEVVPMSCTPAGAAAPAVVDESRIGMREFVSTDISIWSMEKSTEMHFLDVLCVVAGGNLLGGSGGHENQKCKLGVYWSWGKKGKRIVLQTTNSERLSTTEMTTTTAAAPRCMHDESKQKKTKETKKVFTTASAQKRCTKNEGPTRAEFKVIYLCDVVTRRNEKRPILRYTVAVGVLCFSLTHSRRVVANACVNQSVSDRPVR